MGAICQSYTNTGESSPVLYPNDVPRVQECSERSGRSERSARAEQCSEQNRGLGFSVTHQTALPIRIVPRFCARGYRRFEKLLYGCRKPSRWGKTHVLATSDGGHCTVDISWWTLYVGQRTLDIIWGVEHSEYVCR